jgi:hypothetical protein
VTERREVLYPWHPWFGLTVHVHQVVDKGLTGTLRCSVDGAASWRWIELPEWMFDRAACLPMTLAVVPRVDQAALEGLQKLLSELTRLPPVIVAADSGAPRGPRHQNRRSVDAEPAPRFQKRAAPGCPINLFDDQELGPPWRQLPPATQLTVSDRITTRLLMPPSVW